MRAKFEQAIQDAEELAKAGEPWKAVAVLQEVDVESALLRLTASDMRMSSRAEREAAVGHAITKLYETWSAGHRVVHIVGFLKVTAVRHARDGSRHLQRPVATFEEPRTGLPNGEQPAGDPVAARQRAVEIARSLLPDLGLPSVIDTMKVFLDRVAAGDDASPGAIASFLDIPYSTVTTHLSRGLKRLEERARGRDLDALFDDESDDDEAEEWE
jgi:DNA-directed RNA polymerase specialized sigma24 family protein